MRRTTIHRLSRVDRAIARQPFKAHVVREAFEAFREAGDLPDERRLAAAVVRQALNGGQEQPVASTDPVRRLIIAINAPGLGEPAKPAVITVRERLFDEAVYGDGVIRAAARAAIAIEVDGGGDVTHPEFASHHGMPDHASLGMHMLGFPQRLAKPPYVAQAERLFARYAELRDRVAQRDANWVAAVPDAALTFHVCGDLPDDPLMRDCVLADAELEALWQHGRGNDVRVLMAAFDRAARKTRAAQDAAIVEVQRLVRDRAASAARGVS